LEWTKMVIGCYWAGREDLFMLCLRGDLRHDLAMEYSFLSAKSKAWYIFVILPRQASNFQVQELLRVLIEHYGSEDKNLNDIDLVGSLDTCIHICALYVI
jgi:hypothetical protein